MLKIKIKMGFVFFVGFLVCVCARARSGGWVGGKGLFVLNYSDISE